MKIHRFSGPEVALFNATHRFELTYADVAAISGTTSGTIDLMAYTAGVGIAGAYWKLVTGFVGASVTALTIDVGHNGATTDDVDSIIDLIELCEAGTEIDYGDANGAAFATLRTGYFPLDAGTYQANFISTGANLSVMTAGEVHVYLRVVDLNKAS